jgi:hypothetical protein
MEEVDVPPNPAKSPQLAMLMTAFLVKIPRVAAKDKVEFSVATLNEDNLRAAKQVIKIRERIRHVLTEFYSQLSSKYPEEVKDLVVSDIMSGRTKEDNFFKPAKFSYEKGTFNVELLTENEKIAAAINRDLYRRYKKEFASVFQNGPKFKAPVIRIKTAQGNRTCAIFAPYVHSEPGWSVASEELKGKEGTVIMYPAVPKTYDE